MYYYLEHHLTLDWEVIGLRSLGSGSMCPHGRWLSRLESSTSLGFSNTKPAVRCSPSAEACGGCNFSTESWSQQPMCGGSARARTKRYATKVGHERHLGLLSALRLEPDPQITGQTPRCAKSNRPNSSHLETLPTDQTPSIKENLWAFYQTRTAVNWLVTTVLHIILAI